MAKIIQGGNTPLILTFETDMSTMQDIEVSLYINSTGHEVKHWSKGDMGINEKEVTLPITESESLEFPKGSYILEIKWLNAGSKVEFAEKIKMLVVDRNDHTAMTSD